MAKKVVVKVFAFLALFWILIWIVGTSILFFLDPNNGEQEKILTPEELQKLINSWTWVEIDDNIEDMINSWSIENAETGSILN